MTNFLNVLLVILYVLEIIAVLAILVIAIDYIYYELTQAIQRERDWTYTARHLVQEAEEECAKVNQLIADSVADLEKAKLRAAKENEARESFFKEDYFRGFDQNGHLIYRGATAPMEPNWDFFKVTDKIADGEIFANTEDF